MIMNNDSFRKLLIDSTLSKYFRFKMTNEARQTDKQACRHTGRQASDQQLLSFANIFTPFEMNRIPV